MKQQDLDDQIGDLTASGWDDPNQAIAVAQLYYLARISEALDKLTNSVAPVFLPRIVTTGPDVTEAK